MRFASVSELFLRDKRAVLPAPLLGNSRLFVGRFLRLTALAGAVLSTCVVGTQAQTLVHRWSFENDFTDSSGSGNTGNPSGAPTFVPGQFGQAVSIASPDDGVNVDFGAQNLPLQGTDSWSMSVWANLSEPIGSLEYIAGFGLDDGFLDEFDTGATRGFIAFGGAANTGFYFWGGAADVASGIDYDADGSWNMYTITYDAPETSLQMYKNAALVASADVTLNNALDEIHVGNPSNWNSTFDGLVDEFAIFNGALNESQIGGLFVNNDINQPVTVEPTLQVDRSTGQISLTNDSSFDIDILGYTVRSDDGALNPTVWNPIAGRLDAPPGGDGSIDPNDQWTVLTDTTQSFSIELSEGVPGTDGATIPIGTTVELGDSWIKNPGEDLVIDLLLNDGEGTIQTVVAEYTGNGGESFAVGDFNADGTIDTSDWQIFRDASRADLSGLTAVEQYLSGDLTGDDRKDISDFERFAVLFDAANGAGSFEAMVSGVPEPGSLAMVALAGIAGVGLRRVRRVSTTGIATLLFLGLSIGVATPVRAELSGYYPLNGNANEATGLNIDLSLVGDASFAGSVHPGLGAAIALDGLGDGAVGANFNKIQTDDVTVTAWVFSNGNGNFWETIAKQWGETQAGQFHFGLGPGGENTLNNFFVDGGGGALNDVSPADLPVGEWLHTAFVLDSTAGEHRLYINGEAITTGAYSGTLGNKNTGATGFGIGVKPNDDGSDASPPATAPGYWNGLIDDVGVYDSALSTAEIDTIYTNGLAGIQLDGTTNPFISLEVDRSTGVVTLRNDSPVAIDLSAYQVASASGSLNAGALESISGEAGFPAGNGSGNGWETDGANDDTQVLEAFLTGTSTLGVGSVSLGSIYTGNSSSDEDLVLTYRDADGSLVASVTSYVGESVTLFGDFNDDGSVNAADYTVWRDALGTATTLPNEEATPGQVTSEDYDTWVANFGNGAGSSTSVPEPTACMAALLACGFSAVRARRR